MSFEGINGVQDHLQNNLKQELGRSEDENDAELEIEPPKPTSDVEPVALQKEFADF